METFFNIRIIKIAKSVCTIAFYTQSTSKGFHIYSKLTSNKIKEWFNYLTGNLFVYVSLLRDYFL